VEGYRIERCLRIPHCLDNGSEMAVRLSVLRASRAPIPRNTSSLFSVSSTHICYRLIKRSQSNVSSEQILQSLLILDHWQTGGHQPEMCIKTNQKVGRGNIRRTAFCKQKTSGILATRVQAHYMHDSFCCRDQEPVRNSLTDSLFISN
jgi:hypothetical protein